VAGCNRPSSAVVRNLLLKCEPCYSWMNNCNECFYRIREGPPKFCKYPPNMFLLRAGGTTYKATGWEDISITCSDAKSTEDGDQ
jgi:hypothetical protein